MPLSVASTSINGRDAVIFTNHVARTDTTAKQLFKLAAGWIPFGLSLYSPSASNAGTGALLSIGSTGIATYFSGGGIQLKSGSYSVGLSTPSSVTNLMEPLAFDTWVEATYAEYGTASTSGGPWTVAMEVIKA